MIELLLKAGADVNAQAPDGETLLMTAARTGSAPAHQGAGRPWRHVNVARTPGWSETRADVGGGREPRRGRARRCSSSAPTSNARSKVLSFPEFSWITSGMVSTVLPRGGWTPLMYAARQSAIDAARRWPMAAPI